MVKSPSFQVSTYTKVKKQLRNSSTRTENVSRMHEFIITLSDDTFKRISESGIPKAQIIEMGKLFLDFGIHAPTVSFPEPFGLMIEPTESYTKKELDNFILVMEGIKQILEKNPEVLLTVPHFTPISKVDEVKANKDVTITEDFNTLPDLPSDKIAPDQLSKMSVNDICAKIVEAHQNAIK